MLKELGNFVSFFSICENVVIKRKLKTFIMPIVPRAMALFHLKLFLKMCESCSIIF